MSWTMTIFLSSLNARSYLTSKPSSKTHKSEAITFAFLSPLTNYYPFF